MTMEPRLIRKLQFSRDFSTFSLLLLPPISTPVDTLTHSSRSHGDPRKLNKNTLFCVIILLEHTYSPHFTNDHSPFDAAPLANDPHTTPALSTPAMRDSGDQLIPPLS